MKTCPECGDIDVILFDTDIDMCMECGNRFPSVKDEPEVYCHECSKAGGSHAAVYHIGPPCE